MKDIILFGIGVNGRKIIETYLKCDKCFHITAIADNHSELQEISGIPVIRPECIPDFQYDEIWIATIYFCEVEQQLINELHINQAVIRYIEYPMPFLEQQIYTKYKDQIAGKKCCTTEELQAVIDYIAQNGVRMYCYSFFDEYIRKAYTVFRDLENGLYYGIYAGHKMYLSRQYDTPEKAEQYIRYIHMEQDLRSPHCYFSDKYQIENKEVGIDIGAAEGVFALDAIDRVGHIYLIEADAGWCEALSMTFREYGHKVTIVQGCVSDQEGNGQIVLDKLFADIQVDFIKMDIEGAEKKALLGAAALIKRSMPKLAVCTYHHKTDNQDISGWLLEQGYTVENSAGYVVCQGEWELDCLQDVDFRRALIWAERESNEEVGSMHTKL